MRLSLANKIAALAADGLALFKDFGVTAQGSYGWQTVSGKGRNVRYPGSDLNWEAEAGELWLNSVVSICLQYIYDKIAEPDAVVVRKTASKQVPIENSPVVDLLNYANPEYRGRQLIAAMALSYKLDGNAYAVKVRGTGGVGTPRELWWVPHWRMAPLAPLDGGPTEFYLLVTPTPSGAMTQRLIPRADVVHARNGLDPNNPRKGMSAFKALLRAIVADSEIDVYTAVIMRNMGIFGALISPKDYNEAFTTQQAEDLKEMFRQNASGDARASTIVASIPMMAQFAGRSPQDMALSSIGDRPQARICAAFGIDPAAVGLLSNSAGGSGEKYGSMRKEARESSMEQGIIPMLSVFAEAWTQELLPDFPTNRGQVFVEYDYSGVRDLQPDVDGEHARAAGDFKGNGTTLNEFRAAIGLPSCNDPEIGEKFYFQLTGAPTGTFGIPAAPGQEDLTGVLTDDAPPLVDDEDDK
jgi:HK97 family phage portal protein